MTIPVTPPSKRFYKDASAIALANGWTVALDARTIKTPAREAMLLPTRGLADAIAAEWRAQGDKVDLARMHLTRLANVAIDRTPHVRDEMADELARFCETDLICHIADGPRELVRLQESHWGPVRTWAADMLGVHLVAVEGILPSPQPDASLEAARTFALGLDDFRLTGLLYGCGLFGSALLAMAATDGAMTALDAFETSRIDETWQMAQWGEDSEAIAAAEARRTEARALVQWIDALG